jgi:molybdopterin molybdotransferase
VAFELFVAPALRTLMGLRDVVKTPLRAPLVHAFHKKPALTFFSRARLSLHEGALSVELLDRQGSGQISGLAQANALVITPAHVSDVAAGSLVDVLPLDDTWLMG